MYGGQGKQNFLGSQKFAEVLLIEIYVGNLALDWYICLYG